MIEIREYIDTQGRSPYARWFDGLNARAAAKVATTLVRMEQGNLSNAKGVGAGVSKFRIDFGPATGSISARMETPSSSCSAAALRSASKRISRPPRTLAGAQTAQATGDLELWP